MILKNIWSLKPNLKTIQTLIKRVGPSFLFLDFFKTTLTFKVKELIKVGLLKERTVAHRLD